MWTSSRFIRLCMAGDGSSNRLITPIRFWGDPLSRSLHGQSSPALAESSQDFIVRSFHEGDVVWKRTSHGEDEGVFH